MGANYIGRAADSLKLLETAVIQGNVRDIELAKRLEAVARRIRRAADGKEKNQHDRTKGKYGRVCNANRAQYRKDVNFLYWQTSNSVAAIARKLGISETSVDNLISRKPPNVDAVPKTERHR